MLWPDVRTHFVVTPDEAKRRSGDQSRERRPFGSALDLGSPFGWPG